MVGLQVKNVDGKLDMLDMSLRTRVCQYCWKRGVCVPQGCSHGKGNGCMLQFVNFLSISYLWVVQKEKLSLQRPLSCTNSCLHTKGHSDLSLHTHAGPGHSSLLRLCWNRSCWIASTSFPILENPRDQGWPSFLVVTGSFRTKYFKWFRFNWQLIRKRKGKIISVQSYYCTTKRQVLLLFTSYLLKEVLVVQIYSSPGEIASLLVPQHYWLLDCFHCSTSSSFVIVWYTKLKSNFAGPYPTPVLTSAEEVWVLKEE